MKLFRILLIELFLYATLAATPAAAQQVQNHAVPVGRGAGVTGFGAVGPCASGTPVVGAGTSADPTCGIVGPAAGGTGANNATNSNADVLASNGTNGNFVHTFIATVIDTACKLIPNTCASVFGYANVVWYGAKADGSTDDGPAFAAAVGYMQSTGGIVFVPRITTSVYCIKTGITVSTGNPSTGSIIFQGSGAISGTALAACGNNTTPIFTLNNQWVQVKNMTVYGFGSLENPFASALPTQPAILLNSGCSSCRIQDVYVTGGTAAIQSNGACGYILDNVWASYSYGTATNILGVVNNINCGGLIVNSHIDMVWPVSQPAHGIASPSAWAPTTAVTLGSLRTVTCLTRTFLLQVAVAGTTGSVSPSCAQYGANITDGTVTWKLVTFQNSAAIHVDTGSVEMQVFQTDMTSATYYGFKQDNTFAGQAPTQTMLSLSTPGGTLFAPIEIDAGNGLTIVGTEVSYCAVTGCAGLLVNTAATGVITASNMRFLNGLSYAAIFSGGSGITFNNNIVTSADTFGVFVNANVTHWNASNNVLGSGITGTSIGTAASGTIDYCIVTNNIFHGATAASFSQGAGSCTNKTVSGNL